MKYYLLHVILTQIGSDQVRIKALAAFSALSPVCRSLLWFPDSDCNRNFVCISFKTVIIEKHFI